MSNILYILAAVIILGVIVVAHEFGHYLAGRLCGIGVVEFSVGFGPKLLGFKRKGIQYSVRAIPLGGFCKFVGEDEENPAPNAMNLQPVWKRAITVAAGPVMNFIFAYLVCVLLLANYNYKLMPAVNSVSENMPAVTAGVEAGDIIRAVNGEAISYDEEGALRMRELVKTGADSEMTFTVERGGELIDISLTPALVTDAATGDQTYQIGIIFSSRNFTALEALGGAASYIVDFTGEMLKGLKNLVFKGEGVKDAMGPVGIITFVSRQISEGMYMVLMLMFVISLNLGIMNLLPLPALDGGRLVFFAVEAIRRKPIPPEKEGMVHAAGFVLLLLLVGLFTYQDIARIVTGG